MCLSGRSEVDLHTPVRGGKWDERRDVEGRAVGVWWEPVSGGDGELCGYTQRVVEELSAGRLQRRVVCGHNKQATSSSTPRFVTYCEVQAACAYV